MRNKEYLIYYLSLVWFSLWFSLWFSYQKRMVFIPKLYGLGTETVRFWDENHKIHLLHFKS